MKKFKVDIGEKIIRWRQHLVKAESIDDVYEMSAEDIVNLSFEQFEQGPEFIEDENYGEFQKDCIEEVK